MPSSDHHYDPLSWRAIIGGVLVACAAWLATRALWYTERAVIGGNENYGYTPNPEGTQRFLRELDKPTFRQAGADALAGAKGQDTFLYRYADKAHRAVYGTPFGPWNQGPHGSCVSFGWGMGSYIGQSVDWATGRMPNPPKLVCTEAIYGGSRTAARLPPVTFAGFNDGSYGGAAARWVAGLKNGTGGILYREKYGDVDLSVYSIPLSKQWGAYGVPLPLAKLANEHTAKAVAQVTDWESLCASIESGYCVPICSNVGFAATSVRDADGFLPRGGSWSHCMVVCGIRYAKNDGKRDGALVLNSWGGTWVSGSKWPADQPDGSFWMSKADAQAILAQDDSFAIGGVDFAYRNLDHGNWLEVSQ
jgi:hypothetical protein